MTEKKSNGGSGSIGKFLHIGEYGVAAMIGDLIDQKDGIEGISLVIKWKKGAFTVGWTNLDKGDLAIMTDCMEETFRIEYIRSALQDHE